MSIKTQTPADIIDALTTVIEQDTIEARLLKPRLIRQLYKQLGEPTSKDFPDAYDTHRYYRKQSGYTTDIRTITKQEMRAWNNNPVEYHIKRPSKTKRHLVEWYVRYGWHVKVLSFNVICTKYVQHPRYPQLAAMFYVSRDVSRYEYVIITDADE